MRSKVLLSMLLTAMFFGACKKDNSLDVQVPEASIVTKSAAEQVKYAEVNLKKIANTVGKLTQNPEFVNFVHTEVAKKRDGQFEVLITRLLKSPVWGPQLNTKELNEGLDAFKNLQGTDFYPQIYIPKMQNDEDNHATNFTATNNTTASDDVKVVVYGGEVAGVPEDAPHPSYNVNDNGILVPFQDIAEPYANDNEVWVFSINEIITTNGLLALPTDGACGPSDPNYPECTYGGGGGSGGGGGGGGSSSGSNENDPEEAFLRDAHPDMNLHNPVNFEIENMTVKKTHEYWLSGSSEISIRASLNTINGREYGNPALGYKQYKTFVDEEFGKLTGRLLYVFKRKWIKNDEPQEIHKKLQNGWPTTMLATDPVYYDYVIFERDFWPSTIQTLRRQNFSAIYSSTPLEGYYSQRYRSNDEAYAIDRVVTSTSLLNPISNTIPVQPPIYYNNGSSAGINNSISFNFKPY
jgi:hypothetical protein